jgi:hypothetical protein
VVGALEPARTPLQIGAERVGQFILVSRRHRVLLDEHLAALYSVETRSLLQAVKRNLERFPPDFMFELSAAEWTSLRSQSVTSKPGRGGRRYAPYAFTEQGVAVIGAQ